MKKEQKTQDSRVQATSAIWGLAVAMFGISIPLEAMAHTDGIIPVFVMLGATISTGAVWFFGRKRPNELPEKSEQYEILADSIQQLSRHVQTLEMSIGDESLRRSIDGAGSARPPRDNNGFGESVYQQKDSN